MKKRILLFAFLLIAGFGRAQEEETTFVPDRPGCTWGAEVLAHHKIAWENGMMLQSPSDEKVLTLNSTIVRYGIFENVELRVGADFVTGEGYDLGGIGMSPLTIGAKIKCYEGEGAIPSVGVLAEFQSPHFGSPELLPSHIAPNLYLLMEQTFGENLSICYNAGLEFDGEEATPTKFLALGIWYSFTDQLGGFVEFNSYLYPGDNQYLPEIGATWLATPKLQVALSAGFDGKNLKHIDNVCLDLSWMIN